MRTVFIFVLMTWNLLTVFSQWHPAWPPLEDGLVAVGATGARVPPRQRALCHRAWCNSAAHRGVYSSAMERHDP